MKTINNTKLLSFPKVLISSYENSMIKMQEVYYSYVANQVFLALLTRLRFDVWLWYIKSLFGHLQIQWKI